MQFTGDGTVAVTEHEQPDDLAFELGQLHIEVVKQLVTFFL